MREGKTLTLVINEDNETAPPRHSPFVLPPDVVFLREVNEVNHGFGCQKQVFVQHFDLRHKRGFRLTERHRK